MKILALDVATGTGWAVLPLDSHPSATICGALDFSIDIKDKADMRKAMRRMIDEAVCRLIDEHRPDYACIEQPLSFIGNNEPKPKKAPLLSGIEQAVAGASKAKGKQGGGPNANTAFLLNQLFAVADTVCSHKCRDVFEVRAQTWQTLTKSYAGDTKARSIAYCRAMKIMIPPSLNAKQKADAADAAVIAQWGVGHLQTMKMLERARATA